MASKNATPNEKKKGKGRGKVVSVLN